MYFICIKRVNRLNFYLITDLVDTHIIAFYEYSLYFAFSNYIPYTSSTYVEFHLEISHFGLSFNVLLLHPLLKFCICRIVMINIIKIIHLISLFDIHSNQVIDKFTFLNRFLQSQAILSTFSQCHFDIK